MPGWRDQPAANLAALVAVVQGFHQEELTTRATPELLTTGAQIYATHCAECHGVNGAGDGFAADQLAVLPTDFRGERPALEENIRVLRNGVEGTPMAPWTDRLSDDEIVAVAHYVREFFIPEGVGQ
mgnify:FL=1